MSFVPTPLPTTEYTDDDEGVQSYIKESTQAVVCAICVIAIVLCCVLSVCMSQEDCLLHGCLNSFFGCECLKRCTRLCGCCRPKAKKLDKSTELQKQEAQKQADFGWMIRYFKWLAPLGTPGSEPYVFQLQLGLLLWKSFTVRQRQVKQTVLYFLLPGLVFFMCWLLYETFNMTDNGILEMLTVPFAFIMVLQLTTVSIVSEKSLRLRESMRMMGLRELPYWTSYFLSDGVFMGFLLAFFLAVLTVSMSLMAGVAFGPILWFFFCYNLALSALSFTLASVIDAPQTAGQVAFFTLISGVVVFLVVLLSTPDIIDTAAKQRAWCLFPPMAIEIAIYTTATFSLGGDKIPLHEISGILLGDVVIYCFLAWYLSQVLPSEYGIQRPPWFFLLPSYWFPADEEPRESATASPLLINDQALEDGTSSCPTEVVDGSHGDPTVSVRQLKKTFGSFKAVNNLSFDLYDGQIFSLLGHNGAGKTTTINMLTGLFAPDASSGNTTIYGSSIQTALPEARKKLGICPQHDVLFDQLTCREHIAFFSILKGSTEFWDVAGEEADDLLEHFHLHERAHYVGAELSGGMKRKLSTAVALCGGSKFVVLDEPTAGMDPLARRELWDLLKSLRHGRTMLLTTHYMDEADVLGDRIAIMSRGVLQCVGSSRFLKRTFGAGYKLITTLMPGTLQSTEDAAAGKVPDIEQHPCTTKLLDFVAQAVPGAQLAIKECTVNSLVFVLPFDRVASFADFFNAFDDAHRSLDVEGYGVTITDLEEVFLRVGEDHTLGERDVSAIGAGREGLELELGNTVVGGSGKFEPTIWDQVYGLWWKRLASCANDKKTIPLLGLPIVVTVVAFVCNWEGYFGKAGGFGANLATSAIIFAGYIPMPGLLAEAIVAERTTRLRNVLTVMGCQLKSYWLGCFLGDFTLFMITAVCVWITALIFAAAPATSDDDNSMSGQGYYFYYADENFTAPTYNSTTDDDFNPHELKNWFSHGAIFFFVPLFGLQLCSFSYACSFGFSSPRLAIVFMPFLALLLIFVPLIVISIFLLGYGKNGVGIIDLSGEQIGGCILWGTTLFSPHAAFGLGLASISADIDKKVSVYPPFWANCLIMLAESVLFLVAAYRVDRQSVVELPAVHYEPTPSQLADLDEDVLAERAKILGMPAVNVEAGDLELRLAGLRKVFPPKTPNGTPLQAVQSLSIGLPKGEVFGLLGANGAGKTTAISMVMRALYPTAGEVHVCGKSVLDNFGKASTHLGVVTQHNTLWDRLSCIDHLRLFARLRGVPRRMVNQLVQSTIKDMELEPYANKLAMQLSGGMKRKLCVAIALIGDPEVVLLDEPSAGLDPVSRRNLWDVILRTMASRSVVLTTHSMEEAEALCSRIGIVVKGQLRVLGTPQHLKAKFGSGYEIVLQSAIESTDGDHQRAAAQEAKRDELLAFTRGLFAGASLLSDNGGLMTFRVPPEEFKIGTAFHAFEENKERLAITDYVLAQPTLEQVFVRTVVEHSGNERPADGGRPSSLHRASSSGFAPTADSPWVRASLGDQGKPQDVGPPPDLAAEISQELQDATGSIRTTFLGCTAKAHRFLCIVMALFSIFLFLSMTGLFGGSPSYDDDRDGERCHHADDEQPCSVAGFYLNAIPLQFALVTAVVAVCGCCCCIPKNPEDDKD